MASAHVVALRSTWRKTEEHYRAQGFRFFGIFGGILGTKAINAYLTGENPFAHLVTRHDWFVYLVPVAVTAYRQWKPALGAKALDTAPGATIVPAEVGLLPAPAAVPPPAADATVDLDSIPADLPVP